MAFLGHAHLRFGIIFKEPCETVIIIQCPGHFEIAIGSDLNGNG